jgi:hypothetical protein
MIKDILCDVVIHKTRDFDKFKFIDGNRKIIKPHLLSLIKSIEDNGYLFGIIVVNGAFEIIDGQHRFKACKQLDIPFYYVIKKNYGLDEVHTLNQLTKNWTMDQFMNSYADMGYREYQMYKFFKEKYNFGHAECMSLLSGSTYRVAGPAVKKFKHGFFKVTNLTGATNIAEHVYEFAPYYEGFRRRCFIFALTRMSKVKDYDRKQMIQKVKFQSAKLIDQVSTKDYLLVLEKIYNFKSRNGYIRFDLAA